MIGQVERKNVMAQIAYKLIIWLVYLGVDQHEIVENSPEAPTFMVSIQYILIGVPEGKIIGHYLVLLMTLLWLLWCVRTEDLKDFLLRLRRSPCKFSAVPTLKILP